jgi:cytochrome c oxidase cbb3-type subunit I/II
MGYEWHRPIEAKWITFTALTAVAIAIGGMVLLIPPFFLQGSVQALSGMRPYSALEQEGRDLYIREGCNTCHSQQVRPLKTETDRYGPYSVAGEGIYDRPFLWGSRRTGPDLARVGGRYPDSWHWLHLEDPRAIEQRSNMPNFGFLLNEPLDTSLTSKRLVALRSLGHPYSDAEIENAVEDARAQAATIAASIAAAGIELSEVQARSEGIAVIAYLQSLGRAAGAPPVTAAMSSEDN